MDKNMKKEFPHQDKTKTPTNSKAPKNVDKKECEGDVDNKTMEQKNKEVKLGGDPKRKDPQKEFKHQDENKTMPKNVKHDVDKKQTSEGGKKLGNGESKDPTTSRTEKEAMEKLEMKSRRDFLKSRR